MVNFPVVRVPVLSKTTCVMFLNDSRLVALRKRMPFFAARPSPTAMAAGVANPMAQGQAITSTAILLIKAGENFQDIPVNDKCDKCNGNTTGTKMALILSAIFCTGGFSPCAFFTRFNIATRPYHFLLPLPVLLRCHFPVCFRQSVCLLLFYEPECFPR